MWKKGQSGNPSGRPKKNRDLAEAAQQHTALALATLVRICGDPDAPAAARVSAADHILSRGWGREALVMAGEGGIGPAKIELAWAEAPPP